MFERSTHCFTAIKEDSPLGDTCNWGSGIGNNGPALWSLRIRRLEVKQSKKTGNDEQGKLQKQQDGRKNLIRIAGDQCCTV